ncbi:aminodeoxychorismate lyase [Larkinella ripae]
MNVVLNGDVVPEEVVQLSLNDRAFQYGDGLFETIRYEHHEVRFWPDHYDRLSRGMEALSLQAPPFFDSELLHDQIMRLLKANHLLDQATRIKLQVWRKPGGLYTPTNAHSNFLLTARSGPAFAFTDKTKVGFFDAVRLSPSPVSAYKTLNALPYVLAGLAKQHEQADDMVLLDQHGHLAECIASNLFWLSDNQLFTPSLASGCIDGILRRQLLRRAPKHGLIVQEGLFLPNVLSQADAVFCTNVAGIQWVRQIGSQSFDEKARDKIKPLYADL